MKKFLLAIILLGTSLLSYAETVPIIPGSTGVITQTMGDDGYAIVPLQFGFPFYGKTFTHSIMFDNGVVGLYDPIANIGCNPEAGWCGGQQWSAQQPNTMMGSQFSYMIAPLWADIAPNPATRYYTQGTTEYQKYMWENIHEYYSGGSSLNTFGLELTPSGSIDAWYSLVNISTSNTFVGTIGDPMLGEWNTIGYYNYGTVLNQLPNWNIGGSAVNPCTTDPLASPSCPGYAEAYLTQQCTINALYNPSCPGYAVAYFNQQCSINALYNSECPGYAVAYLNYQCSINPLYSTACEGYEQAYYNQQCSINALYDSGCPGYQEAYYNQQCSINALYDNGCPGYAAAYLSYQCSLNGLYDRTCPNYSEAYALANVVVTQSKEPEPVQQVTTVTTTTTASTVAVIADPVINTVVTSTSTTTSPAVAAPVVPLVTAPTATTTTSTVTTTAAESKTEDKKETKTESKSESKSESSTAENKPSQSTAREQMVAKRKEAAMQTATRAGAEAAEKLDSATSMAAQVAVQNVVLQAMGYTPGFNAYSYVMPDGNGYKPFTIYKNQKNVDNRQVEGGLLVKSDRLHQQLIELQYKE